MFFSTNPRFSGTNPEAWISAMERSFYNCRIYPAQYVEFGMQYLDGEALSWARPRELLFLENGWGYFTYRLLWEFATPYMEEIQVRNGVWEDNLASSNVNTSGFQPIHMHQDTIESSKVLTPAAAQMPVIEVIETIVEEVTDLAASKTFVDGDEDCIVEGENLVSPAEAHCFDGMVENDYVVGPNVTEKQGLVFHKSQSSVLPEEVYASLLLEDTTLSSLRKSGVTAMVPSMNFHSQHSTGDWCAASGSPEITEVGDTIVEDVTGLVASMYLVDNDDDGIKDTLSDIKSIIRFTISGGIQETVGSQLMGVKTLKSSVSNHIQGIDTWAVAEILLGISDKSYFSLNHGFKTVMAFKAGTYCTVSKNVSTSHEESHRQSLAVLNDVVLNDNSTTRVSNGHFLNHVYTRDFFCSLRLNESSCNWNLKRMKDIRRPVRIRVDFDTDEEWFHNTNIQALFNISSKWPPPALADFDTVEEIHLKVDDSVERVDDPVAWYIIVSYQFQKVYFLLMVWNLECAPSYNEAHSVAVTKIEKWVDRIVWDFTAINLSVLSRNLELSQSSSFRKEVHSAAVPETTLALTYHLKQKMTSAGGEIGGSGIHLFLDVEHSESVRTISNQVLALHFFQSSLHHNGRVHVQGPGPNALRSYWWLETNPLVSNLFLSQWLIVFYTLFASGYTNIVIMVWILERISWCAIPCGQVRVMSGCLGFVRHPSGARIHWISIAHTEVQFWICIKMTRQCSSLLLPHSISMNTSILVVIDITCLQCGVCYGTIIKCYEGRVCNQICIQLRHHILRASAILSWGKSRYHIFQLMWVFDLQIRLYMLCSPTMLLAYLEITNGMFLLPAMVHKVHIASRFIMKLLHYAIADLLQKTYSQEYISFGLLTDFSSPIIVLKFLLYTLEEWLQHTRVFYCAILSVLIQVTSLEGVIVVAVGYAYSMCSATIPRTHIIWETSWHTLMGLTPYCSHNNASLSTSMAIKLVWVTLNNSSLQGSRYTFLHEQVISQQQLILSGYTELVRVLRESVLCFLLDSLEAKEKGDCIMALCICSSSTTQVASETRIPQHEFGSNLCTYALCLHKFVPSVMVFNWLGTSCLGKFLWEQQLSPGSQVILSIAYIFWCICKGPHMSFIAQHGMWYCRSRLTYHKQGTFCCWPQLESTCRGNGTVLGFYRLVHQQHTDYKLSVYIRDNGCYCNGFHGRLILVVQVERTLVEGLLSTVDTYKLLFYTKLYVRNYYWMLYIMISLRTRMFKKERVLSCPLPPFKIMPPVKVMPSRMPCQYFLC